LSKQEFLNFNEISSSISFEDVLNWLNIPFTKTEKELKGDYFIISIEKNLFFAPSNANLKGSVINFLANHEGIDVRAAASKLKAQFLSKKNDMPIRDIPNLKLEYHNYLNERGVSKQVAEEYEVGFVTQRSIMSGRIAFKVYNVKKENLGYIGYKVENDNWFFPKGFKRPLYNSHRIEDKDFVIITTNPFDALRIISFGEKRVVSLLANSMCNEQEEELKKFKNILVLHNNSINIVNRLSKFCFVHAPFIK